jgi:hypothetical protein
VLFRSAWKHVTGFSESVLDWINEYERGQYD